MFWCYYLTLNKVNIGEAKANLSELVRRVEFGETNFRL